MARPQTYKNHAMFDPIFHFVLAPLLLANFGFSFVILNHHFARHPHITVWWIVLSAVLLLMAVRMRSYALKNQDRVIRLEERLRLMALLPHTERAAISSLSTRQLIALRFAPDEELPALARRAASEDLEPKQIKAAIGSWRRTGIVSRMRHLRGDCRSGDARQGGGVCTTHWSVQMRTQFLYRFGQGSTSIVKTT